LFATAWKNTARLAVINPDLMAFLQKGAA